MENAAKLKALERIVRAITKPEQNIFAFTHCRDPDDCQFCDGENVIDRSSQPHGHIAENHEPDCFVRIALEVNSA